MIRRVAALAMVGLVAAAPIAVAPAVGPARPTGQPAARDWSRLVAATPEGGFRMGNPAAPVRLVEYGSLACPHCRHFAETGYRPLVAYYVRRGRVSYEFRNLLLNGPDLAATILAHCGGAAKFFPLADAIFAGQPQWIQRIVGMSEADKTALEPLDDQQRIAALAEIAGLTAIAGRFGLAPVRQRQCFADRKTLDRLLEQSRAAMERGVRHTPTFFINGKVSSATTWEDLEPEIRRALGRR